MASARSKLLGLGVFMLLGAPLCMVLHWLDVDYYVLGLVRVRLDWLALASLLVGLLFSGVAGLVGWMERARR